LEGSRPGPRGGILPPVPSGLPLRCAPGQSAVCARSAGGCALIPAALLANRFRPGPRYVALGLGPAPVRCAPVARLRLPLGGALRRALAGAALRHWPRLRVFGLRSAGPPCGVLRAAFLALAPLRVGPAPVCAAADSPPAPSGPLRVRAPPARRAMAPCGAPLRPARRACGVDACVCLGPWGTPGIPCGARKSGSHNREKPV